MLLGSLRFSWVHSGATSGSSGSFAFVGFIRSRLGGRRFHSGSFGRTLEFVGFIRVCCVHAGAPWGSLGSFVFVRFIQARNWRRRVHSGLFGLFGRALVVFGLIQVLLVRSGTPYGSSSLFGFIGLIRAYPGGRRFQSFFLVAFGRAKDVVVFIRVRRRGCLVYLDSLDSFWCTLGVVGFIRVGWVCSRASTSGRLVYSGSLGSFRKIVQFIFRFVGLVRVSP